MIMVVARGAGGECKMMGDNLPSVVSKQQGPEIDTTTTKILGYSCKSINDCKRRKPGGELVRNEGIFNCSLRTRQYHTASPSTHILVVEIESLPGALPHSISCAKFVSCPPLQRASSPFLWLPLELRATGSARFPMPERVTKVAAQRERGRVVLKRERLSR